MTALPAWIDRDAWEGFVAMRKSIKKPLTDRAELLVIKVLFDLKSKGHDPNASLDQSTLLNWQSVYPPRAQEAAPNLNRTYMANAPKPMTPEEQAASDEARHAVMAKFRPGLRRVA